MFKLIDISHAKQPYVAFSSAMHIVIASIMVLIAVVRFFGKEFAVYLRLTPEEGLVTLISWPVFMLVAAVVLANAAVAFLISKRLQALDYKPLAVAYSFLSLLVSFIGIVSFLAVVNSIA